jgi:hypothetical protein
MKLYRTATFYNPFSIDVNGKSYELADIVFFDKDGVICRTNCGWFMSGITTNNDFNILEIPGDVKKKIKVDFNEKQAFVVRAEDHYGFANHVLYIPSSSVGLSAPTAVRSTMADHHWEITWQTNITGVSITKWHFVDGQSQEIVKEINQIGQDISRLWGDTAKALPKLINQLQQKKAELDKATERALAITADAVLKNYR